MNRLKAKEQEIAATLLGIAVAIILWLTILSRDTVVDDSLANYPFHSMLSFWNNIKKYGITGNFLGNIFIFIPIGFLYSPAFEERNQIQKLNGPILFGFSLSLMIELTQLVFSKGYCEIDDVLLNSVGTAVGCVFYKIMKKKKGNSSMFY